MLFILCFFFCSGRGPHVPNTGLVKAMAVTKVRKGTTHTRIAQLLLPLSLSSHPVDILMSITSEITIAGDKNFSN